MKYFRLSALKIALGMAAGFAGIVPANAQYTNYFSNQIFSNATLTPLGGTYNGGTFTLSNPGANIIALFTSAPGSLPAGSGFSASPQTHTLNSGSGAKTITVTMSAPLTPADHIYLEDLDNAELATLTFYNGAAVVNPTNFRTTKLSSNFNTNFSATNSSTKIDLSAGTNLQSEPLLEIIPDAVVTSFTINFTNPNSGGFAFFFGRNIPQLSQSLSPATITRGRSTKLTYTLSGINNNPIYDLGFTNNLPSGWQVYALPNIVSNNGTLTAPASGSSVVLGGVNNAFSSTTPVSTLTWSLEVTNADGQMNASCSGNPAAFTNQASNYTVSTSQLSTNITPMCFTVTAPLPVELSSFTAATQSCNAVLRWETAFESKIGGYDIERSTDGRTWSRIGQIQAGNRNTPQRYSFVDEGAPQGSLMYRLHILDLGGGAEYSPVAAVHNECLVAGAAFSIAPNPAYNAFSCSFASAPDAGAEVRVQLSDLAGRVVAVLQATSRSGATAGFNVLQLPAGLYLLQASVDGRPAGAGKLILQ
jgi:hypothetical protein